MSHEYDFELRLSRIEYGALMNIRGLAENAHSMVMCASLQDDGDWILQGSHEAFDELAADIFDEIDCGIAPKKNLPALKRTLKYVEPADDETDDGYSAGLWLSRMLVARTLVTVSQGLGYLA